MFDCSFNKYIQETQEVLSTRSLTGNTSSSAPPVVARDPLVTVEVEEIQPIMCGFKP